MNPRPIAQREQQLIELYSRCQLGMTPQQFYAKWQVSHEAIAAICSRSTSTVRRWFARGSLYRRPAPGDLRHLALVDFLLEHFEEMPEELVNVLCLPRKREDQHISQKKRNITLIFLLSNLLRSLASV